MSWVRRALGCGSGAPLKPMPYSISTLNHKTAAEVLHGLLGEGVSSSTRPDPQAKGLGEFVRSRHVDVPEALLDT